MPESLSFFRISLFAYLDYQDRAECIVLQYYVEKAVNIIVFLF